MKKIELFCYIFLSVQIFTCDIYDLLQLLFIFQLINRFHIFPESNVFERYIFIMSEDTVFTDDESLFFEMLDQETILK